VVIQRRDQRPCERQEKQKIPAAPAHRGAVLSAARGGLFF
jgi:hypothetical protein